MIDKKKKPYQMRLWEELVAAGKNNDHQSFWKIIAKGTKKCNAISDAYIPEDT